ncbi:glycoside hydrolase family 3 N-terminal domain-containing protein [Alkalihalobacillus sp. AL-G]|uniref:glycoside hydrolase family 3 N-terminal domain-containing protein n=1 Tax=Alkalihalobacillus sp. AL-G TaxID=2926399 RepID=UPI00272B8669|nr:glycoside hydrolase family 3 N-terminal domain-containing protein [Alkalihalobacillus sp. AL-G]WLD92807.1 glycoside hydrolase family 3 C-terminal domain-containing protein [Alkalihalobacillus sp. AL-G]
MNENHLTSLIDQMTLDEKIAQLMQLATPFYKGASNEGQITGPMASMGISEEVIRSSGSVLGASGAKEIINIQKTHLSENRLGIPLLFMSDIIHGYKTIFPVPLAIGCSWDLESAEKSAEIAAKEAAVSGVHVTFAPMVDLVRDPRWGRVMESTGEDPFLNSQFAEAFVHGFQGEKLETDHDRVAACVKHFAAYGAPEGGRDYNTVDMSERQLREYYLPAYKAALDVGCEMVMTAFNTVDGIPASGNKKLMRDLLRDEWNFDGVLISDWGAVKELIPHGVAEDTQEAAKKAITAGVDIEMMTPCYVHHLVDLVKEGQVNEALIDEAVLRILQLKQKLGLFENPYRGANEEREREIVLSDSHRQTARDLASKSCVLLRNESVLPLNADQKVALIGPFADNGDILGAWSWLGSKDDAIKLSDAFSTRIDSGQLSIAKGCDIETGSNEQIDEALRTAENADVIVLALGEHSDMSGEAGCLADIRLPEAQLNLITALKKLGKPMISVLFNGRPLDLHGVIEHTDAVLEAWYPGTEGGAAIVDLLYGDTNPSGRLTMSFPYSVGQVPVYYNNYNTGRPKDAPDAQERYVSQYLDIPNEPLFPFGFGLSYTTFSYSDITLSADTIKPGQPLSISVSVTNTGNVAGEEVVQLYIRDVAGEVVRPLKELKGFKKIMVAPGETKQVTFELTEEQLRYHHSDLSFESDPGAFVAYVGSNSKDGTARQFELIK